MTDYTDDERAEFILNFLMNEYKEDLGELTFGKIRDVITAEYAPENQLSNEVYEKVFHLLVNGPEGEARKNSRPVRKLTASIRIRPVATEKKTSAIQTPPSMYLYGLAKLLDKSTREMVFRPLIDDFHDEYYEALSHGRPTRRLVWVYNYHGTIALLRSMCIAFVKQLVSGGN